MEIGVPEDVLWIHRLIYENVNGISNKLSNNDKVEEAKETIDKLEVDIVVYNRHRLNMQDWQNVKGLTIY
jgi:hypothetical protein